MHRKNTRKKHDYIFCTWKKQNGCCHCCFCLTDWWNVVYCLMRGKYVRGVVVVLSWKSFFTFFLHFKCLRCGFSWFHHVSDVTTPQIRPTKRALNGKNKDEQWNSTSNCCNWLKVNEWVLTCAINIIVWQITAYRPWEFENVTPLVFVDHFVLWLLQELREFRVHVPLFAQQQMQHLFCGFNVHASLIFVLFKSFNNSKYSNAQLYQLSAAVPLPNSPVQNRTHTDRCSWKHSDRSSNFGGSPVSIVASLANHTANQSDPFATQLE